MKENELACNPAREMGYLIIKSDGMMARWRSSDSPFNTYPDWKDRYGPLTQPLDTESVNFALTQSGEPVIELK